MLVVEAVVGKQQHFCSVVFLQHIQDHLEYNYSLYANVHNYDNYPFKDTIIGHQCQDIYLTLIA